MVFDDLETDELTDFEGLTEAEGLSDALSDLECDMLLDIVLRFG
jgi:hypothetical protein